MVAARPATELPLQALAGGSGTLLVIAPREGLSKRVENALRNAGHPLKALWTSDLHQFERILHQTYPDLVMCERDMPQAPEHEVIALCKQIHADVPVVLLTGEYSMHGTVSALAAGAVDCCAHNDPAALRHLELVVVRELAKHAEVRALRLTQQRFVDFQQRHQHLAAGAADAIATVHEGILSSVNLAFARMLSFDAIDELAGQPLIDLIDVDQRPKIKERLRQVLKGKHSGDALEIAFAGRQGRVSARVQMLLGKENGENVIELLIRAGGDDAGKPLVRAADLPHRTLFANAMKSKPGKQGAVIGAVLAHIDSFDALEHRIGHVQALEITMQLAHAIHARLGSADQSFAFSANEQSLLVQRESYAEIEQFIDSLRKELGAQLFQTDRHEAHVTLSIAIHPLNDGDDPDNVIAQLVDGVRKASIKGGDRVVVLGVSPQARQSGHDLATRVVMVKKALEFNRLKVAYQAIASLEGDERKLFEVLLRLIDENGKEWFAADFLPAAAQAKLMKLIDRWVVQRTLAAVGRRSTASEASVFFVKLSEDTLMNSENFVEWLKAELKGKALRCDEIVFQLQEVVIQNHVGKIAAFSASLRELGAGVSLDHFGIGNTSIQLLDRIPVSFVKFHSSFTLEFADPNIQKRLGELVEAAKHRGIKTVVSHVEDAHVMARLWQLGVNFIQGFHVQEPEVVQVSANLAGARA